MQLPGDSTIRKIFNVKNINISTALGGRLANVITAAHNSPVKAHARKAKVISYRLARNLQSVLTWEHIVQNGCEFIEISVSHIEIDVVIPRDEPLVTHGAKASPTTERISRTRRFTGGINILEDAKKHALELLKLVARDLYVCFTSFDVFKHIKS